MTQYLNPLFGEYSDDQTIARATAQQPGIIAKPAISATLKSSSPSVWEIHMGPNAGLGFWAWRTAWARDTGSFSVVEDATFVAATLTEPSVAGQTAYHLIVGRWLWMAGALDESGEPIGDYAPAQQAVYEIVSGTASATPVDPTIAATDGQGRHGVILARVAITKGAAPVISYLPATMHDRAVTGGHLTPTGTVIAFAGSAVPYGYLAANGAAVSRSTYSELFGVIGTSYGAGDGSTTFALPNLVDRFPVGSGAAYALAATGGEATHILTKPEMPAHTHDLPADGVTGSDMQTLMSSDGSNEGFDTSHQSSSTGGGLAHNNMPPYLALKWIIKT